MKKSLRLLTATGPAATSLGLLILRIASGGFMALGHGLGKLKAGDPASFPDPLGIGTAMSYYGAVTSEFACGLLVAVGLFTRLACLPLIFTMGVAAMVVHGSDPFFATGPGASKEPAVMYLSMFVAVLLAGPGRYSADHLIAGRGRVS